LLIDNTSVMWMIGLVPLYAFCRMQFKIMKVFTEFVMSLLHSIPSNN